MMAKEKYEVVHVKWMDPFISGGWILKEQHKKDEYGIVSNTVGYVIHESKVCIKLCLNWTDAMAADVQCVPKKFMVSRKRIGFIKV